MCIYFFFPLYTKTIFKQDYFEKIQAFENQDLLDAFNLIINNMSKINEDKKQSTLDKYFS